MLAIIQINLMSFDNPIFLNYSLKSERGLKRGEVMKLSISPGYFTEESDSGRI